jgi:hypothetical protein
LRSGHFLKEKKMKLLPKLAALAAAMVASTALAADHLDSPAAMNDPAADITDVYTWMHGPNVVFAMNVFPLADANAKFSDTTEYVLHTESGAAFAATTDKQDIICTFDSAQKIQCWVGTDDYVTGDASTADGITSASGKLKVFAGLRDDPFYFNLRGFQDTVATVEAAAPTLTFDAAGCPTVDAATSTLLVNKLKTDPDSTPPGGAPKDFFAGKNVLSIVIEIDKSLVTKGGPILSVWGSTNKGA